MICPIVEGNGEVQAVPVLLRRLLPALGSYIEVGPPVKQNRSDLVIAGKFKSTLQKIVLPKPGVEAILVLFDADDDCARDCVPQIAQWAQETAAHLPCAVVMARREYEAWFLAALESLRGQRGVQTDASYPDDPETRRGAKWLFSQFLPAGAPYVPTADQAAFTARFDMGQAYRRSTSFRKLVKELCRMLTGLGHDPQMPTDWLDE